MDIMLITPANGAISETPYVAPMSKGRLISVQPAFRMRQARFSVRSGQSACSHRLRERSVTRRRFARLRKGEIEVVVEDPALNDEGDVGCE